MNAKIEQHQITITLGWDEADALVKFIKGEDRGKREPSDLAFEIAEECLDFINR